MTQIVIDVPTERCKTTAERLMLHKNTVQYRIRKAEESLGRGVGEDRYDVELALRATHWLGSSVLQPSVTVIPGRMCTDRHQQG